MNTGRIDYELIGQRIKKRRTQKGITQEKFAEYLDVTVGYVSQIERGITKVNLERLASIAEFFGCSVMDLLGNSAKTDPHYMDDEFFDLYDQLTLSEKKSLVELLKTYLKNK